MDPANETLSAAAAFLSGIGSVLTGYLALRYERKRSMEECEKRMKALHEGMHIRDQIEHGEAIE